MAIDANGNITSYAVTETLGAQTQANGTNQVVMVDDIQANPGNGGNVIGTDYIGRVFILRRGTATEETRRAVSDVAGTGTTRIVTMSESWIVPPASGDVVNVFYNLGDLDGSGTTFARDGRTGFYEAGETVIVGNGTNPAGIWFGDGELVQTVDTKSNTVYGLTVNSNARLQFGIIRNNAAISGGYLFALNNATGEPWLDIAGTGEFYVFNTGLVSPLVPLNVRVASTATVVMEGSNAFQASNNIILSGSSANNKIINSFFTGSGTTLELVTVQPNAIYDGVVFNNMYDLRAQTTGTIRLKNCIWVSMTNIISIANAAEVWNVINPSWGVTTHTDLNFIAAGTVNQRTSVELTVVNTTPSPIANAVVVVYEGTLTQNLELKTSTNSSGIVDDSFIYKRYLSTSTTTYGNHVARVDGWTYFPFISAISTTTPYITSVTLSPDSFIAQTNQATALSTGSTAGVTWNADTNPSSVIEFHTGTGTLSVGNTVTGGTSGATGIVTQILDGDSVSGHVHLRSRNATAFTPGETISNGAGWSATEDAAYTERRFNVWIDAKNLSAQNIYDYLAALTSQTTLSATGELIHEWGVQNQARAFYSDGSFFFTERSGTKGVIVVNVSGSVSKYTSDNGNTYTPPATYELALTGLKDLTEVRVYNSSTNALIAGIETIEDQGTATAGVITSGTTDNRTFTYSYSYQGTDIPIFIAIISEAFEIIRLTGLTLSNSNQTIPIQQRSDRNFVNP